jgi:ABC-type multidrug transport system ATPase subunit
MMKNGKGNSLKFENIHYWVKPKSSKEELHILKGVSGEITCGRFYALLGSSGSGKTTLLDIIAQRKESGHWSGSIEYRGEKLKSSKHWKRICGYVLQHDNLLSTSTVFETLMFSSQLRTQNATLSYDEHAQKVDDILEELSLAHRKHSRIGGEGNKILSGGEMRRVSIGQELVADCKVLLLDEPTSGLDASSAKSIVELLKSVAQAPGQNRIVAATLHQPSSSITELFDDMMLLSHGRVCYQGPFAKLVDHFSAIGFQCPMYVNPTDYIMDLCRSNDAERAMISAVPTALPMLDADPANGQREQEGDDGEEGEDVDQGEGFATKSFWFQFRLLWKRSLVQWWRNELLLISELVQYLFCGFFIGIMYYRFSDNIDTGTFDRLSAIFFILTTVCFIPSFTVITISGEEFPLLKRETSSGMYNLSASFLAKLCTVWPFELFLAILFILPAYFLSGFQSDFVKFAEFTVVLVLALLVSETIGLLCAVTTKTPTIGVLVLSMVMLVCMALGGFLVSEPKPIYEWFEYINFFVYANTAMMLNQFSGLVLYQDVNVGPGAGTRVPVSDMVQELRANERIRNNLGVWGNIAVLAGFLVGLRLLAFALLYRKVNSKPVKKSKQVPSHLAKKESDTMAIVYSV